MSDCWKPQLLANYSTGHSDSRLGSSDLSRSKFPLSAVRLIPLATEYPCRTTEKGMFRKTENEVAGPGYAVIHRQRLPHSAS